MSQIGLFQPSKMTFRTIQSKRSVAVHWHLPKEAFRQQKVQLRDTSWEIKLDAEQNDIRKTLLKSSASGAKNEHYDHI